MIDMRCANALHGRLDVDTMELDIKCRHCSREHGKPVHHRWNLIDVADMVKRGDMVGICEPTDPRFVHWKVTGR